MKFGEADKEESAFLGAFRNGKGRCKPVKEKVTNAPKEA